jgi:hypothetical protein
MIVQSLYFLLLSNDHLHLELFDKTLKALLVKLHLLYDALIVTCNRETFVDLGLRRVN